MLASLYGHKPTSIYGHNVFDWLLIASSWPSLLNRYF